MTLAHSRHVKRAETTIADELLAVKAFAEAVYQDDMAAVIFFCSAKYDWDKLGAAIQAQFDCPVIGCTSAGEIGSTYQQGGLVGASFSAATFHIQTKLIRPLDQFDAKSAAELTNELKANLAFSESLDAGRAFGVVLIDGLSLLEEQTITALYHALMPLSIVGGSAGDNLEFKQTGIYADGQFHSNAALFVLIETTLPFRTFKLQHFEPSEQDMVITESDSAQRIVYEIDGEPAAQAYADLVGVDKKDLLPAVFATYPLMLQIGDEWYMRSIGKANPDDSLTFYCAIDDGLPLTIGKGIGFTKSLQQQVDNIKAEYPKIEITLGFDCILRQLEMHRKDKKHSTEKLLNQINFLGFNTFGEQFNAIHVNQTLTGIVIGSE